jgi:hypothetical protein
MGVQSFIPKRDAKVIVGQIGKMCIARDSTLEKYLALVRRIENQFRGFLVEHIDRSKNAKAVELAKATTRKIALAPGIFFQRVDDASVKTIESEPRMENVIHIEDW